jgi:hypothetical protein
MLVDTDVLIWNLRGNARAADLLDRKHGFSLSAVTWMELAQGARDGAELRALRQAVQFWHAGIIHIDQGISGRASYLVEEYSLAHSLQLADALIAATALERGLPLVTANDRHYRFIPNLELHIFRPE